MEEFDYRNVTFDSSPSPELICSICHCVFYNPVESSCGHVFCKNCIEQWLLNEGTCPKCRTVVSASSFAQVSPLIRNIILSLKVQCQNRDLGCDHLSAVEHYRFHLKTCPYLKVRCTNGDCMEHVLLKDKAKHEDVECLFYIVSCSVCKASIIRHKLYDHNCFEELRGEVESQKRRIAELSDQNKLLQQQVREVGEKHFEMLKGISLQLMEGPLGNGNGKCLEMWSEVEATDNQLKISGKNGERDDHLVTAWFQFSTGVILIFSVLFISILLSHYYS